MGHRVRIQRHQRVGGQLADLLPAKHPERPAVAVVVMAEHAEDLVQRRDALRVGQFFQFLDYHRIGRAALDVAFQRAGSQSPWRQVDFACRAVGDGQPEPVGPQRSVGADRAGRQEHRRGQFQLAQHRHRVGRQVAGAVVEGDRQGPRRQRPAGQPVQGVLEGEHVEMRAHVPQLAAKQRGARHVPAGRRWRSVFHPVEHQDGERVAVSPPGQRVDPGGAQQCGRRVLDGRARRDGSQACPRGRNPSGAAMIRVALATGSPRRRRRPPPASPRRTTTASPGRSDARRPRRTHRRPAADGRR